MTSEQQSTSSAAPIDKTFLTDKLYIEENCNDESKSFLCTFGNCRRRFRSKEERSSHVWAQHYEKEECPVEGCNVWLKRVSMRNHIILVHDKFRVKCEKCGRKLAALSLQKHSLRCRNKQVSSFATDKCDLSSHVESVPENSENVNKISSTELLHLMNLKRSRNNEPRLFRCPELNCNRKFKNEQGRKNHLRNVHSDPVPCPVLSCGKIFKKNSLRRHLLAVHYDDKFQCNDCKKPISFLDAWKHQRKCVKLFHNES